MILSFPFDSQIIAQDENGLPIYDRASSAADFAAMLSSFFVSGVFNGSMCEVLAFGGMSTSIQTGHALLNGRFAQVKEPEIVMHDPATALPRIDTVVLRVDLNSNVNNVVAAVLKGTPDASPVAPSLRRDGTVYEIGLANVRIEANSTAISQQNIFDTRLDNNRCGIVAAVLTEINTNAVHAGFYDLLEEMRKSLHDVYEGIEKVNIIERSAILDASGWSAVEPHTQTVAINGLIAADSPFVDVDMSYASTVEEMNAYQNAWGGILKAGATANAIVFTAASIPEIDVPIKVKVVR